MRVHTSATRGLIPLLGAFALVSCTGSVPAPNAVIAGGAQTVNTGDFVQLDGSGSSDPQNRAITFSWSFAKRPLGSQISLIDANSPRASFKADAPGEFVVELIVSNSLLVSSPARVTVTVADCGAHAPTVTATATPSTTKPTGVVQLTGTASDADNACGLTQTLTVRWTLDSRPQGSTALPTSNTLATTSFTPDKPGNYEFSVIATDSTGRSSQPATVIVTATTCSEDLPGVGSISISAGGAKVMGTAITLQANNVTDTNCLSTGSPQLQWSLTVPAGSRAALDNVFGNTPTFLPDVPGAYVVSVTARNSEGKTSDAVFLTINVAACSPAPLQRPTILGIAATQADPEVGPLLGTSANPIPHVGTTVTLIPDGVVAAYCGAIPTTPLTYSWTVTQRPAGSQAQLDSSVASSPAFTPDKVGHYQFAAVAKDAFGNSTASKTFDFDTSACGTNPIAATIADVPGLRPFDDHLLTALPAVVPDPLVPGHKVFTLDDEPAICPSRFAGRSIFTWGVSSSAPSAGFVFDTLHGTQVKFTPGGNGIYDVKLAVDGPIAHADALIEVFVSCSDVVPKSGAISLTSSTAGYPAGMFFRDDTAMVSATPSSLCLSSGSTAYSYLWSLVSRPAGSASVLSSVTSSTPTFTADVPSGTWTASVIVVDKLGNRSLPTTASFTSESCGINPVNVSFTDTRIGVSPFAAFDPHSLTAAASSDDDVSTKCPARFKNNSYVFTNLGITAPAGATKWMFTPTASNSGRFEAGENGTYRAGVSARGSTSNVSGLGTFDVSVSCAAGNEIPHASAPAITHVDDPDGVTVSGKIFRGETVTVGTTPTAACYTGTNFHPQYAWNLVSADDSSATLTPSGVASPSFVVGVSDAAYDVRVQVSDQWENGPGSNDTLLRSEKCGVNPVLVSFTAPTQQSGTLPFDPWSALATATSDDDNVTKCPQQRFHQSYGIGWAVTGTPSGATKYSLSTASGSQTIFREGEPASGNYTLTATGTASLSGKTRSASNQISTAACAIPGPTFTRETGTVSAIGISATPPTPDPAPDYYAAHPEDFFKGDTVNLTAPTTFSCYTSQADAAATYSWSTVTAPSISFSPNATSATPSFVADAANKTWHLRVAVQDHWGNGDSRTRDISSGVCGNSPVSSSLTVTDTFANSGNTRPQDARSLTVNPPAGGFLSADSNPAQCPKRFGQAVVYTFGWELVPGGETTPFSPTDARTTTFTPQGSFVYTVRATVTGSGASNSVDESVDATCTATHADPARRFISAAPSILEQNGATYGGGPLFKSDLLKLQTSISQGCVTNATVSYAWVLQQPAGTDASTLLSSQITAQPTFTAQNFGLDYVAKVTLTDANGNVSTQASNTFHVSQCGSSAPSVTFVSATQPFASIQHRAPSDAVDSTAALTIRQDADSPVATDGSLLPYVTVTDRIPTDTAKYRVPFYLDEGPSGPAHPIEVTVQIRDALTTTDPANACPSFTLVGQPGGAAIGLTGPTGSTATASPVSPATVPGTVSNGGLVSISFSPDVGDRLDCSGGPCVVVPANYTTSLNVQFGPTTQNLTGPALHVGGRCGRNEPVATFTPPDTTLITVDIGVQLDASGSGDFDLPTLGLTGGTDPSSSGCGLGKTAANTLGQALTLAFSAASGAASTFDFAEGGNPPAQIASTATPLFTAHNPDNYLVNLVVSDGTGRSGNVTNTYTASPQPTQPSAITAEGAVTAGTSGHTASVTTPPPGFVNEWTITNGTFAGGVTILTGTSTTPLASVSYTAGVFGTLHLEVAQVNAAGAKSVPTAADVTVVSAAVKPVITPSATTFTVGNPGTASVSTVPGQTHTWSITGGDFVGSNVGDSISFNSATAGTVTLDCTGSNAADTPDTAAADPVNVTYQP